MAIGARTFTVFRLSRYGVACAAALTVAGMFLYPGGTVLEPTTTGYSLLYNSLSDLGGITGWNGQPNPAWPFHLAASVVFVVAALAFFGAVLHVYSESSTSSSLCRAAGAVVVLAAAGLIGATLTPHDRYAVLHGRFSMVAVWALPVATALLSAATARDDRFGSRVPLAWLALTLIVMAWMSMMLGPRPTTPLALAIPVTLQKIVAGALVGTVVFQGFEAERRARPLPEVGPP